MSPSELEEFLAFQPFQPFRLTLASGDQLIVREEEKPFVSGLALVLRGDDVGHRVTSVSRLVSIPNIVLLEPSAGAPPGTARRRR